MQSCPQINKEDGLQDPDPITLGPQRQEHECRGCGRVSWGRHGSMGLLRCGMRGILEPFMLLDPWLCTAAAGGVVADLYTSPAVCRAAERVGPARAGTSLTPGSWILDPEPCRRTLSWTTTDLRVIDGSSRLAPAAACNVWSSRHT